MRNLTAEDVQALARDPSPANRAATAAKIAGKFNEHLTGAALSASELALAEEVFRLMVRDAEVRVREALAANLKSNPRLPHDVAVALAKDVDTVALPVLSVSEVLTADDLVQIVAAQGTPARLDAIAGRREVDERVSAAIVQAGVDAGNETVVAKLLANPGAVLSEPTLHKVVDRFGDREAVQAPLVARDVLPVTIAERLVVRVAEHLRAHLLARHNISPDLAMDLVLHSRERATVGLAFGASEDSLQALASQLGETNRLTASLVLRSLCMGNVRFFEHAVATLARVPVANARLLIHDRGGLGFKTVWAKAGLPAAFFPAVRAALDVVEQTELDGRVLDPERYSRRIIERILTQYGSLGVEFPHDDLEYLMSKVAELPATGVIIH
ncbi:MAG: DUF2336 domain-containing protein [Rhodospirillaceae bacterium]|nr:DUF2336 domain-containing protein [Rhodospirillaceae bacterium]